MSAIIQSGASANLMSVGATSKAAYVELKDSAGRDLSFGSKATYAASTNGTIVSPATPSDMAIINGSGTKLIKIIAVQFSAIQTTLGTNIYYLVKRSTANSGGTSTTLTSVPFDSTNASATAVVQAYTANPTTGSAVGTITAMQVKSPALTSAISLHNIDLANFGMRSFELAQPITLRGTAEGLAINFAGAAFPTGMLWVANFVWTEE